MKPLVVASVSSIDDVFLSEVNRRDYRAWYGLGQCYEILKMPFYSMYYYKVAQQLRPYDSRMIVALGEAYEKLEKYANALKCYEKANSVGDIEGTTTLRLGCLYKKLGNMPKAVAAYEEFVKDDRGIANNAAMSQAYLTLGTYYEELGKYDDASHFAYKCLSQNDEVSRCEVDVWTNVTQCFPISDQK